MRLAFRLAALALIAGRGCPAAVEAQDAPVKAPSKFEIPAFEVGPLQVVNPGGTVRIEVLPFGKRSRILG